MTSSMVESHSSSVTGSECERIPKSTVFAARAPPRSGGYLNSVNDNAARCILEYQFPGILRVFRGPLQHRQRVDPRARADDPSTRSQETYVPQGLQQLGCDDGLGLAARHERARNALAEADHAHDASSPLGHSVDFARLHVKPVGQKGARKKVGRQYRTLTTDSGKHHGPRNGHSVPFFL